MNIRAEGKTHLGAVIGSTEYCDKYVRDLVKVWEKQLRISSTSAKTQPQAAYLAFKRKPYFLRTIPSIHHLLLLPVERTVRNKFIPAVTGCHICSDKE